MSIEKYLILNKYLLDLFGMKDVKSLFNELRNKSEDLDSDGKSYFVKTLELLKDLKIKKESLWMYDDNIQSYVKKIRFKRGEIRLKYFQYLAVLFTEIVLDKLKNEKNMFLNDLNNFLENYKKENSAKKNIDIDAFNENDLKKLAFWMATGSGKTLIMHINYHQFLNYKLFSPDNIILITPNEGLSKQHYEELKKSGIPCKLYNGTLNSGLRNENEVLVIEITKIVEEKKGKGLTMPVDVFEGKNLVFVDEGHKGRKSEEQKWAKLRDKLAENGFVFEYSATFGQILNEKNSDTLQEYAKSIIFDYSYKYFYLDGYGKDFSFLNVKQTIVSSEEFQETMFVANLLSFFEQLMVYEDNKNLAKQYNIEKPLWIFVGTTVTGKEEESDVVKIVQFIRKAIEKEDWLKERIDKIINCETGFVDERDKDIFENRFTYLKEKGISYDDLYKRIFGGKGPLRLYELKNSEGEIGLKIGENDYFGVINIGNISDFKKHLQQINILLEQDVISPSLFDSIKMEDSKINILIGSKKFIEGWDTWRVSSMGLLNIGKGQGPQIIQLFGRGVRLKGKNMSLKRSGEPQELRLLETLNIFGIEANYLNNFLEAIKKEEVEFETIEIPVKFQHENEWKNLYILSKSENKFEEKEVIRLKIDSKIKYIVNLLPKISAYVSSDNRERDLESEETKPKGKALRFPEQIIELIDWQKIMQELIEFKKQRNYWNLVFDIETIKKVLLSDVYEIISFDDLFKVKSIDDFEQIQNVAILVIKKYIDTFYEKTAKHFETKHLYLSELEKLPVPFISDNKHCYILQIDKSKDHLIKEIRKLADDLDKLCQDDFKRLPRIYLDRSLYIPLLIQNDEIDKISPSGLVESEKEFILDLKKYLETNKDKFQNVDIYLLRNYPFSGIGFQLVWSKFYPDFIMWIKKEVKQHIVFIDPKGLEHSKGLDDEKITFAGFKTQNLDMVTIKDIERSLNRKDIILDSFILSSTSYNKLINGLAGYPSKDEYEKHHVLFLEDEDCVEKFFKLLSII